MTNKPVLLLATANPHKVEEMTQLLTQTPYQVLSASQVPSVATLDPEETAPTIAGNAELKARAYGQASQLLSVADDSGLEIEALGGAPGVKSKRYVPGTDQDRNNYVLQQLLGQSNRRARFVTVLCLYNPVDQTIKNFTGIVEGTIAEAPRGNQGFGYDPIFVPDGYNQSFAELGSEVKNQLSHRARAAQQLQAYLLTATL